MLGNLLSNAVKFTAQGHVLLATRFCGWAEGGARLEFSVTDTGIGISEEAQRRLFQPFSQADASTARRFGGSGLGLVLCRRIVEGMAGRIELRSEEAKGSTFTVTLELPVQPGEPRLAAAPPAALRGARVLLADASAASRAILERQLGRMGAAVETSSTALDCVARLDGAALAGRPFDAVVVDLGLPDLGGEGVGRQLRADPLHQGLALVLLSAPGLRGEEATADSAGFDAYLVKPAPPALLADALGLALERRRRGAPGPLLTRHSVGERDWHAPSAAPRLPVELRVLLAEDHPVNQKLAQKFLESMGARLEVAADGAQVLEALERSRFDLVLMDCQMPGMDGFMTTARIRERERIQGGHLPIIAMTAHALEGDREHCLAQGMDDYLSKPVTRQALWSVLSRWSGVAAGDVSAPLEPAAEARRAGPSPDDLDLDVRQLEELEAAYAGELQALYAEVLDPYLALTAEHLGEIDRALRAGDGGIVVAMAHRLKGSSVSLGFVGMGRLAQRLELGARSGSDQLAGMAAALQDEFRRVGAFVERRRASTRAA